MPNDPKTISKTPTLRTILSIPKLGIKKNPADKLPKILPSVDQKKIWPEALPTPKSSSLIFWSFIAKGEIIPSKKLCIKNSNTDEMIGPSIIDNLYPMLGRKISENKCKKITVNPLTVIIP